MNYILGKLPARKNSLPLRLRDYLSLVELPAPPDESITGLKFADNNTFGNTEYGDCVCAGAGHETLLWNKEANHPVDLTTENILTMYSDITGFKPNDPSTDQGTDIVAAAKWRKQHGLIDLQNHVHKVAAYVSLTPGNSEEVKQAIYLFGALGVGWALPESALEQAQENTPWSVVSGSPIAGGHYTAAIGYDSGYLYIISWGKLIKVEWNFFSKYNDESVAYFSEEALKNPDLNDIQLLQDLENL